MSRPRFGGARLALAAILSAGFLLPASGLQAQDDDEAHLDSLKEEILEDDSVHKRIEFVLDFKPIRARMITPRRGPGKGKAFWYLVYEIHNKSENDEDVNIAISATSDRKKTYADQFLPTVEREVERQERSPLWGKTDKFLKSMKGRDPKDRKYRYETIKAGEKRRCVAVFNRFEGTSKNLTIKVKGLSNDIEAVTDPDGGVLLKQKVRLVHLRRPGDEYEFGSDGFRRLRMEWVEEITKLEATEGDG